ncbi:hypothetical protein CIL05_13795 [Virgibacillus profundi]|uniref:DUF2624 domain-containing protein n=1 Tax=Virgibacillus profundi TaxID=2024555 RepID=A0A2A2ICF7_9BACI|nr:DUF2624 family protein [Virgibacillus profundi]PAV29048.1 hypothetical protein CIL05_13795 [Virgibacillus profundi]PXY53217.1 DUF2624 domain-containing protein [Virgibacillus profundi]
MSIFIKEMIKNKLKQLSPEEILYYGKQYGFSVTETEAQSISTYVRRNPVDPFNKNSQEKMFKQLAGITNTETAKKAQNLFYELIKTYGLEHLFN